MLANPEHPRRQDIETTTHNLMLQLADSNSEASKRLNQSKDDVLDSPQVLNFISGAVAILCDAIKTGFNAGRFWYCNEFRGGITTAW